MSRRSVAASLVVAVLLAGCGGTAAPGTSTPGDTPTPSPTTRASDAPNDVAVRDGDLPVDPDPVFARVTNLTGVETPPPSVTVRDLDERRAYRYVAAEFRFFQLLGVTDVSLDDDGADGFTRPTGDVAVDPGDASAAAVERLLAHEFVHTVQFRSEMLPWGDAAPATFDERQARQMLVEGSATYVTDAYVERYQPDATRPSTRVARAYRAGPAANSYAYAHYHFGYRYVANHTDSPAALADAYRPAPNTTEQVLHGDAPADEPPRPLSVAAAGTGDWTRRSDATALGELAVRVLLRSKLDPDVARTAAAGWGADRLVAFERAGRDASYAWVLRWDTPADAAEFRDAMATYADRRGDAPTGDLRVERAGDATVVVFAGDSGFVSNATATAAGDDVTVAVGGAS